MATIYKICEQALWRAAEPDGVFLGSLVETKYPNPGDSVRVEIEGLGALVLEVAA